jgi:uncharacterized protein YdhG (YjbR/CyaY superfamily)
MQEVRIDRQADPAEKGLAVTGSSTQGINAMPQPGSDPAPARADTQRRKPSMKESPKSSKSTAGRASGGFTAEERAAMKQRAQELKAAAGESEVLAKIAEMQESDRALAERLHAIIKDAAPELSPRTWYGMPAYAKDGTLVCFFQSAQKFKTRYATLGFSDKANLDEGTMWPTSYALTELTAADETRIADLVKQAVS